MPSPKTALLVIDMQNFFSDTTSTPLSQILRLSEFFATQNLPIFFTQHGHPPKDLESPITNQVVRKWGVENIVRIDTEGHDFLPEIASLVKKYGNDGENVIQKNVYDAFIGTDFEKRIRLKGVERVVVTGVLTDCCCDATGRSAFNRGFETWMVSDATGTVDKEQHEAGLKTWSYGYGDVIEAKEVMRRIEAGE